LQSHKYETAKSEGWLVGGAGVFECVIVAVVDVVV
jgi:hypothetical protein